jgi:hypothetical protein
MAARSHRLFTLDTASGEPVVEVSPMEQAGKLRECASALRRYARWVWNQIRRFGRWIAAWFRRSKVETEEKQSQEQQARAVAVEIRSIIQEVLPQLRAELSPDSLPRLLAAGALARQLCLLEGMIAICDAGQARIAGLITRAQWETLLVGLYCMLANKEAAKALLATERIGQESTFSSHPGFEALIRNLKTDGKE